MLFFSYPCTKQTDFGKGPPLSSNNELALWTHCLFSRITSPHAIPSSLTYPISGSLKLVKSLRAHGSSADSMLFSLLKTLPVTPCVQVVLLLLPLLAPLWIASNLSDAGPQKLFLSTCVRTRSYFRDLRPATLPLTICMLRSFESHTTAFLPSIHLLVGPLELRTARCRSYPNDIDLPVVPATRPLVVPLVDV